MKKFLLATVGLIALGMTAPASAADLAARPYTKAPPPVVAVIYDWSGFYIGANGGWGESRNCWGIVPVAGAVIPDGCVSRSGGLVGGQVGYRWQIQSVLFSVWKLRAIGRISAARTSAFSIRRSRLASKLMA